MPRNGCLEDAKRMLKYLVDYPESFMSVDRDIAGDAGRAGLEQIAELEWENDVFRRDMPKYTHELEEQVIILRRGLSQVRLKLGSGKFRELGMEKASELGLGELRDFILEIFEEAWRPKAPEEEMVITKVQRDYEEARDRGDLDEYMGKHVVFYDGKVQASFDTAGKAVDRYLLLEKEAGKPLNGIINRVQSKEYEESQYDFSNYLDEADKL